MTISSFVIDAKIRNVCGKNNCNKLRQQGYIPAVLYGYGNDAVPIFFNKKELLHFNKCNLNEFKVFQLKLENEVFYTLLKYIQMHPVVNQVLHIDFQKIKSDDFVDVKVPFKFIGIEKSIGIKSGGVLFKQNNSITVKTMVKNIPAYFEVDVSNLNINDSIHLSDLNIDTNILYLVKMKKNKMDYLIASLLYPRVSS